MDKRSIIILSILVIGIIAGTIIYTMGKFNVAKANNSSFQINYSVIGTVKIYNTSALIPFLSSYINTTYVKLVNSVVKYGIINFIKINNTKGIIGYFKGGPLSSLAFYQINSTLTSHGFKYAEYQTLLYDYNTTTAIGFDGNYFYVVHQNSTNQNLTITLLYYLYTSNKTFTVTSLTNIIVTGSFRHSNFTAYSENSNIIVKGYFKGNFNNFTKFLRYFNFTTTNFTIAGKVIFKNSTVEIFSLSSMYENYTVYAMIGLKEISSNTIYAVGIVSQSQISESEVLNLL
ncbi:hypothetical protein SJAV_16700 [Sulfurisphaera javensis]|uniref:Uncharacterized protein n=1 Tax=Sulfurisphaera javensis TaxID=2049879 RepID=A0AAT9GSG3_9CREN